MNFINVNKKNYLSKQRKRWKASITHINQPKIIEEEIMIGDGVLLIPHRALVVVVVGPIVTSNILKNK